MYEQHARALRYLAWIAAALFPVGIVIETLKHGMSEPWAIYVLLGLTSVLCLANCHADWRADKGLAGPPRG